jgi:TRAP-type C4-dicarboxylate transport system permease small subunit
VKQKAKRLLAIIIVILALGTFITATVLSGHYSAPSTNKVTVASLHKRLTKKAVSVTANKKTTLPKPHTLIKRASHSATSKVSQQITTHPLTNTGPGNIVLLGIVVFAIATLSHLIWQRKKFNNLT